MGEFLNALNEGTRIGPIVIGQAIGQGGEGIIYRAQHDRLGEVAVKEFFPGLVASRNKEGSVRGANPSFRRAFEKGLAAFRKISERLIRLDPHQNVVRFDELIEQETAYLVMQYVDGYDLGRAIARGEFSNPAQVMELADCLSSALVHLHKAQIHHRDIAPDNILIREHDGQIYLIDFNAAKDLVYDVTHSSEMLSKPGYSPPEQYLGTGDAMTAASDIYSACAVLHHAITGKRPPDSGKRRGMDTLEQLSQHAAGRYPAHFLAAIDHGLELDQPNRPQSAVAWRQELGLQRSAGWDSGGKPAPGGTSRQGLIDGQPVRSRKAAGLAMAAVAAIGVLTGISYLAGFGPFNDKAASSGIATDQATDAPVLPAPSQSELEWASAMQAATPIIDGLWFVSSNAGKGNRLTSEQYGLAAVTFSAVDGPVPATNLPEQSFDQSSFPFGADEFHKMRFGASGRYFINGDRLKATDPAIYDRAQAVFGDLSGKKLTVDFRFHECIDPTRALRANLVPPPPCTKMRNAAGMPVPTLWDMRLELDHSSTLVGNLKVENKETMTIGLDLVDSAGNMISYDDGSPMNFSGSCSFKRGNSLQLTCDIYKNNGKDFRFTADMDLVARGKIEGSLSFDGDSRTLHVTLSNPRESKVE